MASATLPARATHREPTIVEALLASGAVLLLFFFLKAPGTFQVKFQRLELFLTRNDLALEVLAGLSFVSFLVIAGFAQSIARQRKMPRPARKNAFDRSRMLGSLVLGIACSSYLGWESTRSLKLVSPQLSPIELTQTSWSIAFTSLGLISGSLIAWMVSRLFGALPSISFTGARLPKLPMVQDGIVLGSVFEAESKTDAKEKRLLNLIPSWVLIGLKGLTGNLFISGAIGSGKSQALLQFLRQILTNFEMRPAMLAIDPKRTFVRELRKIIESLGMSDSLVWVSLKADTRLNPIWVEGMLKNSGFTTIANSLKLASINFIGSSNDSKFWEQSSFNLLKNCLIYCAAKYDYFTFKELYQALVLARDEGLAASLVDCLNAEEWDDEERGNIESAIQYFSNEFSQMDEKIRTSILATATGFLNDFLEYRVSKILSPRREEINFPSFRDAVREGKLICLNIENDALARSIGTLIKLLYQEAVLDRVTDGDLAQARYAVLVMDEYQDVATSGGGGGTGDDRYLAKARESKSITIAATQSVSSLENTIKSEPATRELLQGFRSRIFGNTTDPKTIRVFQEPRGVEDVERSSHSFSETSPDARMDLLFGGYDSAKSNISHGISTHNAKEYPVTAKEFSRLRTFESFAQIFDGLDTRFEKLYLKPYYLKDLRTPHCKILHELRLAAQVRVAPSSRWAFLKRTIASVVALGLLSIGSTSPSRADVLFPNICSVVKSPQFSACVGMSISSCVCAGIPPRPCAHFSYYIPQSFVEVWPNSKESFFTKLPGAAAQLSLHQGASAPFGTDDEMGSFSFQGHALAVPLSSEILSELPCGGTRSEKTCFDVMSEDMGSNWSTGKADLLQPKFLAWGLAKKVCLLKGAITSATGGGDSSIGSDGGGCSYPLGSLPTYPPSTREACNGWGLFYPRSGVYDGASRAGAALMVASRLKSLGVEVSHTMPGDSDEQWQMVYPQTSSCFREGQNLGFLETISGVREEQRLMGKTNGYLFVTYKRVSCCKDLAQIATTEAALSLLPAVCEAVPGGGV